MAFKDLTYIPGTIPGLHRRWSKVGLTKIHTYVPTYTASHPKRLYSSDLQQLPLNIYIRPTHLQPFTKYPQATCFGTHGPSSGLTYEQVPLILVHFGIPNCYTDVIKK
jgi:hypothetical protein